MIAKSWKRGITVVCLGLGVPGFLWWAANQAIDGMFTNDEQTTRVTVLPMLDGRVSLGLYRQHMWDAVLWTVIATPDSLPNAIPAPNAVLASTLAVVTRQAQLGFQDPPLRLEQQSRTDASLCGRRGCQAIRCADATRACQRVVVP